MKAVRFSFDGLDLVVDHFEFDSGPPAVKTMAVAPTQYT